MENLNASWQRHFLTIVGTEKIRHVLHALPAVHFYAKNDSSLG